MSQSVHGPWRRPVNPHRETEGSIHHDATAQRLGLKGGTVAGNNLLELFPRLMVEHFGPAWFEAGSVSMYFREPISDREQVRAVVEAAEALPAQMPARVEKVDGTIVAEGSVAMGLPAEPSALRARKLDEHEPGEIRILAAVTPGQEIEETEVTVGNDAVGRRVALIEEPLAWYSEPSPWGGQLMPMSNLMGAMQLPLGLRQKAVGLFGAIELAHIHGPALVGKRYRKGGIIRYIGTSPKTEYVWYDSWLADGETRVAEMRFMLRFMKASSPLWQRSEGGKDG